MDDLTKVIEVYKRDKTNLTKTWNIEFVTEYDISTINTNELKSIINTDENDENIFLTYVINTSQIVDIQKLANVSFDIDNEKFIYMFTQYSTNRGNL